MSLHKAFVTWCGSKLGKLPNVFSEVEADELLAFNNCLSCEYLLACSNFEGAKIIKISTKKNPKFSIKSILTGLNWIKTGIFWFYFRLETISPNHKTQIIFTPKMYIILHVKKVDFVDIANWHIEREIVILMSALFNVDNPSEIHFRPILRSFLSVIDTKLKKNRIKVRSYDTRYTLCHTLA